MGFSLSLSLSCVLFKKLFFICKSVMFLSFSIVLIMNCILGMIFVVLFICTIS